MNNIAKDRIDKITSLLWNNLNELKAIQVSLENTILYSNITDQKYIDIKNELAKIIEELTKTQKKLYKYSKEGHKDDSIFDRF